MEHRHSARIDPVNTHRTHSPHYPSDGSRDAIRAADYYCCYWEVELAQLGLDSQGRLVLGTDYDTNNNIVGFAQ